MTDPSVDTDGGAVVSGNVNTEGGTFIGRDQNLFVVLTDYTGGDLEKVLPALREALRSGKADFKSDPNRKRLTVAAPAAPTFILSEAAAADLLSSAAHNQSEDDYLAALQVNPRYGRWAAQFVPLAGTLTEVDLPPGWADVPPEFTLLELQGDGPQRQFKRTRLENINQALDQHPACVLLGEPGAGKTTVLRKLALDQAARKLQRGDGPLPIMLTLADYRRFKSPFEFVESAWQKQFGAQPLADRLRGGGLLLLVDSLNEMPFADERDYRQRVADWRNFAGEWPGNCFVFSCRSRDYSEPLNLPQVEIEKLDDERVRDFLQKYLPADLAAVAWERLRSSPLLSLVLNPYYLSMLAYLIHRGGEWPRNRAELFDHFARLLLLREQDRQHPNWPGLDVMQNALSALAESLQPLGQGTRLPRPEFLQRFPAAVRGKDGEVAISPKDVLELGLAANLLDAERPTAEPEEQVRFYHHQVQEYFAARALLARFNAKEDLSARWRQPRLKTEMPHPDPLGDSEPMPPPPTTGWEEPTVLAAALAPQP
ncbi:MAG: NACHT domain-containing protein, partial [Verrucomicrobia bacterium]|nr:NACHT domain-containing protein [Verrucomicrobiota bacterium]